MATLVSANTTPRLSSNSGRRPDTSMTNRSYSSSTTSSRLPDAHQEFASEAAIFLSGNWMMKKKKPTAQRQRRDRGPAVHPMPRISESSASHRRSTSTKGTSSRPQTSQTMPINSTSMPSSPSLASPRSLNPSASTTSLRLNETVSIPKKKSKLLSFKMITPRAASRSASPQQSPKLFHFETSVQRELDDAAAVELAMDQLPPSIKPAAAKLLGISVRGPTSAKSSASPSPVIGQPEQRTRSALSSRPQSPFDHFQQPPSRPRRLITSPSMNSFASESTARPGAVSPATGHARPEHPLEAEARRASSVTTSPALSNLNSYLPQPVEQAPAALRTTFYSSSEDEDEEDEETDDLQDDGLRSSGYSLASSQTSYDIISPVEPEVKIQLDGAGDWDARQRPFRKAASVTDGTLRRSPDSMIYQAPTNHQQQSSMSSSSSRQTNRSSTASATGVVRSFSRPFTRPTPPIATEPDTDFVNPRPAPPRPAERATPGAIGVADGQPISQLAAIRESSPEPPTDAAARARPNSDTQSATHRRQYSGSRRVARPRPTDTPIQQDHHQVTQQASMSLASFPPPVKASLKDRRSARPLSLALLKKPEATISAASAEATILRILECLDSFKDLSTGAMLNKGFFSVYKKNELRLLKNALRNMSPAQWELREASPKEIIVTRRGGKPEYTPKLYVQFHSRDLLIVRGLKSMLVKLCQSQLRAETVAALEERDPTKSARVDDAFWRIWTFCTVFGSSKRRMQDIESQVDWLQGGNERRQDQDRPESADSNEASEARGSGSRGRTAHLSPDSFGRGNYGGLSLDEMYDMMEIWECLKSLLRGLAGPGRIAQAKAHGVFRAQRVVPGDRDAEQALLDEWVHWLPTQGLMVIEDMARETNARRMTAFTTAEDNDWTTWEAPAQGQTRADFLRDAVDRARAEKATASQAFNKFAEEMPVSERRKSRGMELTAQLRDKERGFDLQHASTKDDKDNFFGLWLAWSNRVEGRQSPNPGAQSPKPGRQSPMPQLSKQQAQRQHLQQQQPAPPPSRPLPQPPVSQQRASPPHDVERPVMRTRGSNNSLSLFPPPYKPRMTPTTSARVSPTSSPTRSRQNSVVRQTDSIEKLKLKAMQQARAQQSTSSPRLEAWPESRTSFS